MKHFLLHSLIIDGKREYLNHRLHGLLLGFILKLIAHDIDSMDEPVLKKEALRLPPRERALLADSLLSSLDNEVTRQIEADNRLKAHRKGEIPSVDGPRVLKLYTIESPLHFRQLPYSRLSNTVPT